MSTAPEPTADSTATVPEHLLLVSHGQMELFHSNFPDARVVEFPDVENAIDELGRNQSDLVVIDAESADASAPELIRTIRSTSVGACVPILVVADQSDEPLVLDCIACGADDFLTRPFSEARLRLRVGGLGLRQQLAKDANPLTGLPGNDVLKQVIQRRLESSEVTGICLIDLDHFKEFNDAQGFDRGDHVIQLVAHILRAYSRRFDPGEVFVGHIGGDDFVAVLPMTHVEGLAEHLFEEFSTTTEGFYTPEEAEKGFYVARNRRGEMEDIPLVSVSIGVVTTEREGMDDLRRVAQVSAEVKSVAKKTQGNSLFIDRRIS